MRAHTATADNPPFAAPRFTETNREGPPPMTDAGKPCHVLIVEDNPADAFLVQSQLEANDSRESYLFTAAATLADCAAPLAARPAPDVALLDLGLPDGLGTENVSALRGMNDDVPIVVLTGNDDEALALACIDAGAQDFLWKGELRANALRRAIRHAMTRHRETAERIRLERALHDALTRVLSGFVPICSHCKKIRDDDRSWAPIETYLARHSAVQMSHSVCPSCIRRLHPEECETILRDMSRGREEMLGGS